MERSFGPRHDSQLSLLTSVNAEATGKTISETFRKCALCHARDLNHRSRRSQGDDNDFKDLQISQH